MLHYLSVALCFPLLSAGEVGGDEFVACLADEVTHVLNFKTDCTWMDCDDRSDCSLERLIEEVKPIIKKDAPDCPHSAKDELLHHLAVSNPDEAHKVVEKACEKAFADRLADTTFQDMFNSGDTFPAEFFNGGTYLHNEPLYPMRFLHRKFKEFGDYYYKAVRMVYPEDIGALSGCKHSAVMCCYTRDGQPNDYNGNCGLPMETNCVDAKPGDNTDVCYMDNEEYEIYPGDNDRGEGPVHCNAFAWDNANRQSLSYRLRGNLLAYDIWDDFARRGYQGNITSAPTCGCLENMPVVSRADCKDISVEQVWKVTLGGTDKLSISLEDLQMEVNVCRGKNKNNDFQAFIERLAQEGKIGEEDQRSIGARIVGNGQCHDAIVNFLKGKGLSPQKVREAILGREPLV